MLTPAQKFRQAKLAKKAALQESGGSSGSIHGKPRGTEYELLLAKLAEDRRVLSTIKSEENKAKKKQELVQDFDGWVDGVLKADKGTPDEIVSTMMVWNLDAGNYRRALDIASYMIEHDIKLPDPFKRGLAELLMDMFGKYAETGKLGTLEEAQAWLEEVIELTDGVDANDQPKSKLLRAHAFAVIGRLGQSDFEPEGLDVHEAQAALAELRQAYALNDKVGVKKDIEKLERYLKNTAPEQLNQEVQPAHQAAQVEGENKDVQTPGEAWPPPF